MYKLAGTRAEHIFERHSTYSAGETSKFSFNSIIHQIPDILNNRGHLHRIRTYLGRELIISEHKRIIGVASNGERTKMIAIIVQEENVITAYPISLEVASMYIFFILKFFSLF